MKGAAGVKKMNDILSLCKRRGFVYQSSSIYGGMANAFDYGPIGVLLKKNIQDLWWKHFVTTRYNCLGLDSAIIQSPKVWEASGHVHEFVDTIAQCSRCNAMYRADHLVADLLRKKKIEKSVSSLTVEQLSEVAEKDLGISWCCPQCKGKFSPIRKFNLLFSTTIGASGKPDSISYLRPETAQGVYINYQNLRSSYRVANELPFGVGQMGKAFRNEISPGQFLFRTREFEQAELQWFCNPKESEKWFNYWVDESMKWLTTSCGINPKNLKVTAYSKAELAHYAIATSDIEYKFPFGFSELWGIANRGSFDLEQHAKASNGGLLPGLGNTAKSDKTNEAATEQDKKFPHVIEPALGINRLFLAIICDAMAEEVAGVKSEKQPAAAARSVLKLHPDIAPYTFCIMPVVDKDELIQGCQQLFSKIAEWRSVDMDIASTSIGKKYRRQDEIGTKYCISVDNDNLSKGIVTVRERDSMKQIQVPITAFHSNQVMHKELSAFNTA